MTTNRLPTYTPTPDYAPVPWSVTLCDRFDPDFRYSVRVDAAIGRHDAIAQARLLSPEGSPLDAKPVTHGQ